MTNTEFIKIIYPIIVQYAQKYEYNTAVSSAICAQACIDSAYGRSELGWKHHNYFGIKCGSSWTGDSVNYKTKEEYTKGTLTTIRDNFRSYKTMQEGVEGYFIFISALRYAALKTATSPLMYLTIIKNCGYATSYTYVTTNYNCVTKVILPALQETQTQSYAVVKKGNKNATVKFLQECLNKKGYQIAIDSNFGPTTEKAVKDFQTKNNLVADGIVGPKTWNLLA